MAARSLVLNDVLCFLFNKYGKTNLKTLKSVVSDFYTTDVISEAKICLLDEVGKLSLSEKLPHIPRRREGDSRLTREVDDLFTLMSYIDEQGLYVSLPCYVTNKPDALPGVHLCDGDLKLFVTWLEKFETKLDNFESVMAAIAASVQAVHTSQSQSLTAWPELRSTNVVHKPPPLVRVNTCTVDRPVYSAAVTSVTAGNSTHTSVINTSSSSTTVSGSMPTDTAASLNWVDMMATPNRYGVLASDVNSEQHEDSDDHSPYTLAESKRKKRKRDLSQRQQQRQQQLQQSSSQPTTNRQSSRSRRGPLLIGSQTVTDNMSRPNPVVAAKQFPKKTVLYIDNIDSNVSVADLRKFVSEMSVRVVSCFDVKPRNRRSDQDDASVVSLGKAFRLCILQEDCKLLLDPCKWPAYVRISEWYFRPQQSDQRRRSEQRESTPVSTETAVKSADIAEPLEDTVRAEVDNSENIITDDNEAMDGTVLVADLSNVNVISVS